MGRRYPVTFRCEEHGCRETARYEAETRREESDLWRRYHGKWRCWRHTDVVSWLTPRSLTREIVLTVEQKTYGRFWREISNGYAAGPGFNAYASEFPPGTRLTVTARVTLPSPQTPAPSRSEGTGDAPDMRACANCGDLACLHREDGCHANESAAGCYVKCKRFVAPPGVLTVTIPAAPQTTTAGEGTCECGAPRVPHWCHRALAFVGAPAPGSASPPERAEEQACLVCGAINPGDMTGHLKSHAAGFGVLRDQIAAAESSLSALREGVGALAEEWEGKADSDQYATDSAMAECAAALRALVDDGEGT